MAAEPIITKPSADCVWSIVENQDSIDVVFPDWDAIIMSEAQWEIFHDPSLKKLINAGTGFGKDWLGILMAMDAAQALYEQRVNDPTFRRDGPLVNVAICAPTEPNYKETWDKLLSMVPPIPGETEDGQNYDVKTGKYKTVTLYGRRGIRFNMVTLFAPNSVRGQGWDICLITEAAFMPIETYKRVVLKRITRGNYYGMQILISTPNPEDEWWDDACDQAQEGHGLFGDFQYFYATSFDNPTNVESNVRAMLAERATDPFIFDQERMAKLHMKVQKDGDLCPFNPGLIECTFYKERPTVRPDLAVFDLMYGGTDRLCRGLWNEAAAQCLQVRFWTSKELGINVDNPYPTLKKLIEDTHSEYGAPRIAYDAQGRYGGAVSAHIDRFVRLRPMRRSNPQKNEMVEDALARMGVLDANKRSVGMKLPHPEAPWLSETERKHMRELRDEFTNYRRIIEIRRGKPFVYYTKGPNHGDDGVDMVTWSCSLLPPMRKRNIIDMNSYLSAGF